MNKEDLKEEINLLFNPEPDENGFSPREYPDDRIVKVHNLDISYMDTFNWEGASTHPYTRICDPDNHLLHSLSRNMDVPVRLFEAGLRLYGDSIIEYYNKKERKGEIRYYPSIIMTFWGGFETYIRYCSELMLITVKNIPQDLAYYLREQEAHFNNKGDHCIKDKYHPILDRYSLLLKYGYNFTVDKGNKHWQALQKAKELRDYYTHLNVRKPPRSISSQQVLDYMEAVMLAIIWPSCELKRILLLGIYRLYSMWIELRKVQSSYQSSYIEQPFFKDWPHREGYMFHCNFENVDTSRFPNSDEDQEKRLKHKEY